MSDDILLSKLDDIFHLINLKDLPKDVKKCILRLGMPDRNISKVLLLFDIKDPLSTDEIIVGLFRKYNVAYKNRASLLCALSKETLDLECGRLVRVRRGVWSKKRSDLN